MKNITIKINTENAAFEGCPEYEVARILRELAEKFMGRGLYETPIRDINGNPVGAVRVGR